MDAHTQLGRDIVYLLTIAGDAAIRRTARAWRALRPHLRPAVDLYVGGTNGEQVTGLLLVENNRVVGGLVLHSHSPGAEQSTTETPIGAERTVLSSRLFEESETSGRLRGWAHDPRDGGEPWR